MYMCVCVGGGGRGWGVGEDFYGTVSSLFQNNKTLKLGRLTNF